MSLIKRTCPVFDYPLECWIFETVDEDNVLHFWFRGHDVATALGYVNPKEAIARHVDPKNKQTWDQLAGGYLTPYETPSSWMPHANFISEPGLYALIFQSKLKEAKQIRDWVFEEVLPSLRRDGEYRMRKANEREKNALVSSLREANAALALAQENTETALRNVELEKQEKGIALKEKELAIRNEDIAVKEKEIAIRNAEIEKQKKELALRNVEIAHQEKELALRNAEIAQQEKELALRNTEIAQQEIIRARQDEETARQETKRERHYKEIARRRITEMSPDVVFKPESNNLLHTLVVHETDENELVFTRCQRRSLKKAQKKLFSKYPNATVLYEKEYTSNGVNVVNVFKDRLREDKIRYSCKGNKITLEYGEDAHALMSLIPEPET